MTCKQERPTYDGELVTNAAAEGLGWYDRASAYR